MKRFVDVRLLGGASSTGLGKMSRSFEMCQMGADDQGQTLPTITADTAAVYAEYAPSRLEIKREDVFRGLGVRTDRPAHRRWCEMVDDQLEALRPLIKPAGVYRIDAVSRLERRTLGLDSGGEFTGAIGAFLRHSEYAATFVVTIGPELETLAREHLGGTQIMLGSVIDAIASEAAEAAAEALHEEVRGWAHARKMDTTPRYSPGYCGMNVTEQRMVFASLPTERIGVELTESCLMLPIKSVSGLIGIAAAEKVGPYRYPCETCNHPYCMQRRVEFNPQAAGEFDWEAEPTTPKVPQ